MFPQSSQILGLAEQMIALDELKQLALERLDDAHVLAEGQRYSGAIYLSGYAVEIALKRQICQKRNLCSFPLTDQEFRQNTQYKDLRTHNLDLLLESSGIETTIKRNSMTHWSIVYLWRPEARYEPAQAQQRDADNMLRAVEAILKEIWNS